jgi:hypothetical protein
MDPIKLSWPVSTVTSLTIPTSKIANNIAQTSSTATTRLPTTTTITSPDIYDKPPRLPEPKPEPTTRIDPTTTRWWYVRRPRRSIISATTALTAVSTALTFLAIQVIRWKRRHVYMILLIKLFYSKYLIFNF